MLLRSPLSSLVSASAPRLPGFTNSKTHANKKIVGKTTLLQASLAKFPRPIKLSNSKTPTPTTFTHCPTRAKAINDCQSPVSVNQCGNAHARAQRTPRRDTQVNLPQIRSFIKLFLSYLPQCSDQGMDVSHPSSPLISLSSLAWRYPFSSKSND